MTAMLNRLLLVFLGLVALATCVRAQVPYESNARVAAAAAIAKDSLNDENVILIRVLSPGPSVLGDNQALSLADGRSIHWIYGFYSSRDAKSAMVMQLQPINGMFVGVGVVIDTIDAADSLVVDPALSFANSPKMAEAIRGNADFQTFKSSHPGTEIDLAMLSRLPDVPIENLPGGFPLDQPMWIVTLSDRQDSTAVVVCLVSASNGLTACQDISEPVGGVNEAFERGDLGISVAPNPASGDATITISAPDGRSLAGARVGLFDASGALVMDLTRQFEADGGRSARFDASAIPSGTYYCRAVGPGINGVIGIIVR